jgi:ATP-dependent helicase/nuclease subunit B
MTVYSIAPGLSFVDALALGLMERAGPDPLALSAMTVLLPTRRACRALREAFLRQGEGKPMLLPRMMPLGDPDEDELAFAEQHGLDLPPAISPLRRQLLLARLIVAKEDASWDQAARLAAELARFLDQTQTEGLDLGGLAALGGEYAGHWQATLDFLSILGETWPLALKEEGRIDPAERRNLLIQAQAARWRRDQPPGPVVAAGSTGSIPATADLLAAIAGLPQGAVVLPGLDRLLDAEAWNALEESHPQFGMKALLAKLGVEREQVQDWPGNDRDRPLGKSRLKLISEAFRPAGSTEAWRKLGGQLDHALLGVELIEAPGPREEAMAIALLLREALERPGATAALVTPDRGLARRVASELGRWKIAIDDSAGQPLSETPPGVFLRLAADAIAQDCAPIPLLALLKHPLAALGEAPGAFRARVRHLEIDKLRGPRPAPGLGPLKGPDWVERLDRAARPLADLLGSPAASLAGLLAAHIALAEALAASQDETGAQRLWQGEAGESASGFVADLAEAARDLPPMPGRAYPALLDALMEGIAVRPSWGRHPRLHIWGPLEARLQQADLLVLGGLNEGSWPEPPPPDPWMSRPMRGQFGLPSPERKLGLAAHDVAQALAAPRVVMTRATRSGGAQTVASRWLMRLEAVLQAAGQLDETKAHPAWNYRTPLLWADMLDQSPRLPPARPPAPTPPLAARPRELAVTQIETLIRDPYALYAKKVLRLAKLDPVDADPGAAEYGSLVHKALERYLVAWPDHPPLDPLAVLLACGREVFAASLDRPGVWAFWWPRFERAALWIAERESERRPLIRTCLSEVKGSHVFQAPQGPFTVTARADRIDLLKTGGIAIIDYKTGAPPSAKEVEAGFAPQLPLEAAIALSGGFAEAGQPERVELLYWRLKGSGEGGQEISLGPDAAKLAEASLAGLMSLAAYYDRADTPYAARPHPGMDPKGDEYDHLERIRDWRTSGGEGEE